MRSYYRALQTKDARFDGRIFFGVRTTRIYCRPVCPARTPLERNLRYYSTAAAAEEAGFRPCKRCRPDAAPGSAAWRGATAVVQRALRLMTAEGGMEGGFPGLSARLGLGERQLRRLFVTHLGAPPQAIYRVIRLDFARRLVDETRLPMTEVALASGFESLRRFNDDFKKRFGSSPTCLRGARPAPGGELRFHLAYREPFDWAWMLEFLKARAIPGVEAVAGDAYRRVIRLGGKPGWLEVKPGRTRPRTLELTLSGVPSSRLLDVQARIRHLFDLDADSAQVEAQFARDPVLGPLARRFRGTRIPGAWDGFELAVRAILGQQISVAGARTLASRIVDRVGKPVEGMPEGLTRAFPSPEKLARAKLDGLGITGARIRAIQELARQVASGRLALAPSGVARETREQLLAIPGFGPWTAEYVALRAMGDPDAFLGSDLIVKRALTQLGKKADPDAWKPWRGYVVFLLWRAASIQ